MKNLLQQHAQCALAARHLEVARCMLGAAFRRGTLSERRQSEGGASGAGAGVG